MTSRYEVLIASPDLESRRMLREILVGKGLDPICSSSAEETRNVLTERTIPLVFCEEVFLDDGLRGLLSAATPGNSKTKLVVTSRADSWHLYLQSLRIGSFDVIHMPCQPTDVEWVLFKAMHEIA